MSKEKELPVKLEVQIDPEGLKRVVEEGRLFEFVEAFSNLAGQQIRGQLIEELAKAGTGATKLGGVIDLKAGFYLDEPYYTGPFPWPWPRRWEFFDGVIDYQLREVIREEIARMQ